MPKRIRAEVINRNKRKWFLTHSKRNATKYSKKNKRTLYRLPNGVYAVRKKR